ncbi:hypothetical protein BKA65DRAFT_482537 [Rhexocercosporidium sp. MPI-PUGE-AT-0058]|nr:hypothetical protein BKA65DRAFT_482537 [Rhexocercosporidium sp. MPI-PUGE-AT-0058]
MSSTPPHRVLHPPTLKTPPFLPTISSTTAFPSPSRPYAPLLAKILTHQKDRKTADDEVARQLKDKMIVEYRNQSEQHEKLATEFVGRVQAWLGGLVATLVNQVSECGGSVHSENLKPHFHESINNYLLSQLGVYQKAVKKHKLNSRQRTDRFSGKAFARYTQTLEKDEADLLDLFKELDEAYQTTFPSNYLNLSSATLRDQHSSMTIKQEHKSELEMNNISVSHDQHDSDSKMDGFFDASSSPTPDSCSKISQIQRRKETKRKLNFSESD